jgi:hypothetical protein
MEVDHFNPAHKDKPTQSYSNLYLATRHCNLAKRRKWPNSKEKRAGCRFLDCCSEMDYGVHLFEDSGTHELVGVTPAGRWHIIMCDLNAPHFTDERRRRAAAREFFEETPATFYGAALPSEVAELADAYEEQYRLMIPYIPPPPETPKELTACPSGTSKAERGPQQPVRTATVPSSGR